VLLQPPPDAAPIIINLPPVEPKSDLQGLADVLFGALGLTGVLVLGAVLLGVIVAGAIYLKHARDERRSEGTGTSEGPGGLHLNL
jgi:hypothetical protein